MRSILCVLWREQDVASVTAAALAVLAGGGVVHGLYVHPPAETLIPSADFGLALSHDYIDRIQGETRGRGLRLRRAFEAALEAGGARLTSSEAAVPATGGVDGYWIEAEGPVATLAGALGRVHDLVIVARPENDGTEAEILLESALFESGRPVLAVPAGFKGAIGRAVLIAWNGSTETARAVALALPLIKAAERVAVVSAEGAGVPGPSAGDLAKYLAAHGVRAEARHVAGSRSQAQAGAVFLQEAKAMGADLVIKGAYTQSRLRQLVFGGATRHMILNADLPVLFAH